MRERVETVIAGKHMLGPKSRFSSDEIAEAADADLETTRGVLGEMIDRGTVEVESLAGDEWLTDCEYSDTRWDDE
ncbi:hypothetical protein [Halorussus sp. AFM4]|uniref:hypothetical protein n=1 Tax=Halorussus sp. AFM4 TaxID=3421651 RepID=UPI003EC1394A